MDKQEWSVLDIDPNNEVLLHGGKWSEEAKRRVSEARRAGRSVLDMFGDLYKKSEKTVNSAAKTASNLIRVAKKGVFSQGSKTTTITRVKSITDAQGHKVGPKKGNGRKVGPKTAEAKRRKTDYERGKAMDKRYADEKRRKTDSARGKAMDERERRNRVRKSNTERERSHAMSKGVKREAERNRRDRMNDFQKRKKGLIKRGSLAGSLRQSATFDYQAALSTVSKKKIKMN